MRTFITGDVHRGEDIEKLKIFKDLMSDTLTRDDYLIVCGDFGILWMGNPIDQQFLANNFSDFPCTILWVDGNHENFDLLEKYPEKLWKSGRIHQITDHIIHLMRGEIFTLETVKILAFGGARSTDRGYNTGINAYWWKQELPDKEEKQNAYRNLSRHGCKVDYIVTHDAPYEVLINFAWYKEIWHPEFNKYLDEIMDMTSFKGWYFAHHHCDQSQGKFHCLYNSIKEIHI